MDANGGPIHSQFEDDPSYADAIEAFVVALAERIDALQDNEASGDWPRLIAGCGELATAAKDAGYPALAESTAEVSRAAQDRHAELAYKALVVLTDVAQRIRRAHRGAL
jgi:predicted secreted protein